VRVYASDCTSWSGTLPSTILSPIFFLVLPRLTKSGGECLALFHAVSNALWSLVKLLS